MIGCQRHVMNASNIFGAVCNARRNGNRLHNLYGRMDIAADLYGTDKGFTGNLICTSAASVFFLRLSSGDLRAGLANSIVKSAPGRKQT
jgi:hypothetical protein